MAEWQRCTYCNRNMRLVPHFGGWAFMCPYQNDGGHPIVLCVTSNNTIPPQPQADPRITGDE